MVSHRKRSKTGGRQNPNAARKTPQKPELQRLPKPPRLTCVSCRSIGVRCNGDRPCSHCEGWLKSDCVYEDPMTSYPTIYKVKGKNVPQQSNQHKVHGNDDTNKAIDRASGPNTHKSGEPDEQGFRKQLDKLNEAHFLRSKASCPGELCSSPLSQNAPPPTGVDAWASTNATCTLQPASTGVLESMDPLPMTDDSSEPTVTSAMMPQPPSAFPPSNNDPSTVGLDSPPASLPLASLPPPLPPPPPLINNACQPKLLGEVKQTCSRPSSVERGEEEIPNVPKYACHLIDKNTGSLKQDQKVAVVGMLRQLRSALKDVKAADKKPHKPIMPPYELSLYLLRVYHREVCYLFPFICFSTFMRAYRSLNSDDGAATGHFTSALFGLGGSGEESSTHPLMFRCALFTMLSHAARFSQMKEKDRTFLSRAFWECACAHLTPALVKENSLAAVQTFLIIAVSFNSTRFSGDERRIPIEIAHRLAQHMRLDDVNDGVMRSPEEKETRMKAWYGCVMMTSFVQTAVNFRLPLSSRTGTKALESADQTPPDIIPFSFFTGCVARCEELEKILKNMPKARSHIFPKEFSSRYSHGLAELLEMFAKFLSVLPVALDWTTMGIPSLEVDAIESVDTQKVNLEAADLQIPGLEILDSNTADSQTIDSQAENSQAAACNTSFMFIRSMLFSPIFMEAGIQECLASGEDISTLNTVAEQKARFCAIQCLKNAIHLLNYMHKRSMPRARSREPWWWDPYHVGTVGLIIIMAQTSESLWTSFDVTLLKQAWKYCQELLIFDRTNSSFKRDVVEFLWKVNGGISKGRVLANEYFMIPEPPSATERGDKAGFRTWTFDVDPSRLEADGIIRIPYSVAQNSQTLPDEDYMDIEISPRTRVEDVLVMPQASADWSNQAGTALRAETAAMSVSNAFNGRPSLTASVDTDFSFTPGADLDFAFTPGMMDMDFALDPNADSSFAQPNSSSGTPFSPSRWDTGRSCHRTASASAPSSLMPFSQAQWTACYDPTTAPASSMPFSRPSWTAGMAYSQPRQAPGMPSGAPPLKVMHFNPTMSSDQRQPTFSRDTPNTPSQPPVGYTSSASAAFHGGNIFLNGLTR
ncbi:hypothetical protein M441DRAFT_184180 [Trichoderma asperellum CBS 433.97]|uniref:Zn(2)-C6 fungal-type domain-containing protein n=1 Tax=Trichoderma asperellum (strain ATCC 204424 / CBS 433.97 / NBRC 101777) TaxID=1042311 RepID=A0A2T3ZK27_TRIA4|nr:hypothetical protein M441DRAFT_184180 [Trichoderma asperellum CBS 433.97]PTB45156.1 hypothetical protein M441DRAFT_184180 [Trichoderma asperellum CBS 433.97]